MKPYIFYILIVVLIILIPFCGIGLLGTMVTEKYQIEHPRMFVEMDEDIQPYELTKQELDKIDKLEKEVHLTQSILVGVVLTAFFSILVLFLQRKKIIKANS